MRVDHPGLNGMAPRLGFGNPVKRQRAIEGVVGKRLNRRKHVATPRIEGVFTGLARHPEDIELAARYRPHRMNGTCIVEQEWTGISLAMAEQGSLEIIALFAVKLFYRIPVYADEFYRIERNIPRCAAAVAASLGAGKAAGALL